jgi:hypothetical protein
MKKICCALKKEKSLNTTFPKKKTMLFMRDAKEQKQRQFRDVIFSDKNVFSGVMVD